MLRFLLSALLFFAALNSSLGQQTAIEKNKVASDATISGDYLITKIDSTHSYYIVYGLKNQNIYKIISKNEGQQGDLKKIEIGETYFLNLNDLLRNSVSENPLTGYSASDPCFYLDDTTEICREEGVLGPYTTKNLIGLFYDIK